ncbi:UDP-N-acetylmuramoyl-tripeptide--D-alanyl-D-alanine ligase [Massilia sp. Dwa41.01b]|uniref:UDP-N-acetylmuramoyl-tripeptide--D-alanyl-D- alanine ligase n=1 Tax=unclassified Massilia TaxID=2609279 RepID=UPI001602417F|nr:MULTISPECIES: UDP-N-acetylmuramoyl-tripeptide--D-alanyl-D-alanine ligase [unclassified Massilia]QNA88037.1 UDP-N-acetylmuramoyl-tripeptide--D-alanyl-D-alanine ligase [Massilia sp. Dwa41.01b]QNA98941.1 UDP-N-acetylmuramoyl-tripeptide--D-alanyl-D-alanine ligase [Massilia sp. Se16.2.3]
MRGSLAQLASAIDGAVLQGDAAFESVSTDSRTANAGVLFVALRGERFDAHDFLPQVAANGAAAVVAERLPEGWTLPALVVPDTLVALGRIANSWRRQYAIPVIGVTGSNGKTTVKEMIASILAAAVGIDARLATQGNLNNEIGVPLTLMRLESSHRAAVVELGMNHPGEIARLAAIAEPTVGLVNNAQREHQEFMHTVEAVALENGSVFAALPASGVAVYPGDDTYTPLWQGLAKCRSLTFGLLDACDVRATFSSTGFGNALQVTTPEGGFALNLAAAGEHNVRNALAAIACTLAAGIEQSVIVRGLEAFAPVGGRLQRKQAVNGALVIDDTYNANPDSMRAAIDVLAAYPAPRFLVIGDMGEVGTQGREFTEEIGAYAQSRGIETVLATGELSTHLVAHGATHFEQFDELLAALDKQLGGNSDATVLVKGSRFMKMERVVHHLTGSTATPKDAH